MRKRIALVIMGLLILASVFMGSSQASGDNNTYNNGEDGNYEDNNNNPYDDETFPGQSDQQRSGVVWP